MTQTVLKHIAYFYSSESKLLPFVYLLFCLLPMLLFIFTDNSNRPAPARAPLNPARTFGGKKEKELSVT